MGPQGRSNDFNEEDLFVIEIRFLFYLAATSRILSFQSEWRLIVVHYVVDRPCSLNSMPSVSWYKFHRRCQVSKDGDFFQFEAS